MKPTEFREITQNNGHYNVQGRSRSGARERFFIGMASEHGVQERGVVCARMKAPKVPSPSPENFRIFGLKKASFGAFFAIFFCS